MKIIGCDFHTRYQQIDGLDEATRNLITNRGINRMARRLRDCPPAGRVYRLSASLTSLSVQPWPNLAARRA